MDRAASPNQQDGRGEAMTSPFILERAKVKAALKRIDRYCDQQVFAPQDIQAMCRAALATKEG